MTRLFESKPFLIAEVGSNWATLDHCLESIRVAKECGADAVKFQAFTPEAMYGFDLYDAPTADEQLCDQIEVRTAWEGVLECSLPLDWLPRLKAECDKVGIEFMCTAFSPELLAEVDPYVEVHKIASSDAAWPQMLEEAARTGKPVLVSTGAKVGREYKRLSIYMAPMENWVQMECVAAYPADYFELDLIQEGTDTGFSDHTLGYTAAVQAARLGAIVIEKHFTAFPDLDTPDRPHSLTPKQFKRMVDIIRGREVESEETAMFLKHNRRLTATRDVQAGDVLTYGENFGAYRSLVDDTRGASPFDWESVQGRRAKGAIARGTAIALEDVE